VRNLHALHTLEVRHLHSDNTMVHTSTFRNYKVSSEKKKVFVPPSENIWTTFRIFKKGCCFFLNVAIRTPFYHFLLKKKAVFELRPDNVGFCPDAEAQHGFGGA
jgi:hypothetical protein